MAPDPWGIEDGYWDVAGAWHDTAPSTARALRVAMGGLADVADPPPASRPVWIVQHGTDPSIERPADLVLEDGTHVLAIDRLPPDLPLGYHDLHPNDGGPVTRLIVTPDRCHLPDDLRAWGWAVQLYTTRSADSWGIGDFADLRTLAHWSCDVGAGVLAVNPFHAPQPLPVQEPSPYFPSSRRFVNPLYLRIEEVDGFDNADATLADAAAAGRALNDDEHIDRDAVHALKLTALAHLYSSFTDDPRFDTYVRDMGNALRQYALYCVLAEHHGAGWREWPSALRRPDSPGVERFAAASADRVRFHMWVQWLLDEQLGSAASVIDLVGDLAVGVDPDGADAWVWQDVLAPGVRVGAPPDEFNQRGQNWGSPPFVPWRLRASGYEPLAATLRGALRHAQVLRIDHVMGLFRLFWIPEGGEPSDGAYVRYPATELLDIVALESARAGAVIVGEDLGTVEDEVRARLYQRAVLSYRLVWFEADEPTAFPEQSLAAVTTHDLPTIAGVWTGADEEEQRAIGLDPPPGAAEQLRARLVALTGLDPASARVDEVALATYAALGRAPSRLVTPTLEDALGVTERPNLPGTTTERDNWSQALPSTIEELVTDPTVLRIAARLSDEVG
jgi:4-alpha-glucanotransferase